MSSSKYSQTRPSTKLRKRICVPSQLIVSISSRLTLLIVINGLGQSPMVKKYDTVQQSPMRIKKYAPMSGMGHTQGSFYEKRSFQSGNSKDIDQRRMFDGTSERELIKAMTTFLNATGAGDYSLPSLDQQNVISSKRNAAEYSFKIKHKKTWFPHLRVDFQGSSSPAATKYSPKADKAFPSKKYSSPRDPRFHQYAHMTTL